MSPEQAGKIVASRLGYNFFHFDPDGDTFEGKSGSLVFSSLKDNNVFFLPLQVGLNLAEHFMLTKRLMETTKVVEKLSEKMIEVHKKRVAVLQNKVDQATRGQKIQEEIKRLDRIEQALEKGEGPTLNFPPYTGD